MDPDQGKIYTGATPGIFSELFLESGGDFIDVIATVVNALHAW